MCELNEGEVPTPRLSRQAYYDLLVDSSLNGVFPSRDERGDRCVYRSHTGNKCAVGVLLPSDCPLSYEENTMNISQLLASRPDIQDMMPDITTEELRRIQSAHDLLPQGTSMSDPWDHEAFVKRLQELGTFKGMVASQLN